MKKQIVKEELKQFVKHIKSNTIVGMDKHLCDHLLWMIDEHHKTSKIDCARCDKEIKKPETNCYCDKCISDIIDFHYKELIECIKKKRIMWQSDGIR